MASAASDKLPPGPIFLIGFMGVGKTTVGQLLAQRLGRPFIDLDALIVERTGQDVPALFAARGEAGFRKEEAEALRVAARTQAVIATGGGAPTFGDNLQVMRAAGPVLLLSADTETLVSRLGTPEGLTARPLLADAARGGLLAELVANLAARRAAAYAQADLVVDTSGADPPEVVERALAALRRRASSGGAAAP